MPITWFLPDYSGSRVCLTVIVAQMAPTRVASALDATGVGSFLYPCYPCQSVATQYANSGTISSRSRVPVMTLKCRATG